MNPFNETAKKPEAYLENLKSLYPASYDKNQASHYTKARIILAVGGEYEANWFSHQSLRYISDLDLRRDISLARFIEKEQQQKLSMLKPADETALETTIAYEQLAVDLTAEMAQKEKNFQVKKALDFALLEDFDHLYRYADLLDMDDGIHAERLVGKYTEIMPGRPTHAHHRHPSDNVKAPIVGKENNTQTNLNTMIITAAEQQTMNYYMNQAAFYRNDRGRKLFEEISFVEEEHVTQYGCLIDTNMNFFEKLLWHEYAECFVYFSNFSTETDSRIKKIWELCLETEISHLHKAEELLKKYAGKDHLEVIPSPDFPEPLALHENIDYVREILKNTVQFTGDGEDYESVNNLEKEHRFFSYNGVFTAPIKEEPGHKVIKDRIESCGEDYRYEREENPVFKLRNRNDDDTEIGINPDAAPSTAFKPL